MQRPPKKQPGQGTGRRTLNGLVLDVRSGAAFIGISEKAIRGKVARGVIPYRRLGGRIIFLKAELEGWLAALPGVTFAEAKVNSEARYG